MALRAGCLTSGNWQWTRNGKVIGIVSYHANVGTDSGALAFSYSDRDRDTGEPQDVECLIRLEPLPCHYGGIRWYGDAPTPNGAR